MNSKIYNEIKYTLIPKTLLYSTFTSDNYGQWDNQTQYSHSGYTTIEKNHITSKYAYIYGAGTRYGYAWSERTIYGLQKARDISFTFKSYREKNNISIWSGWDAHFYLFDGFIKIMSLKNEFYATVNDVQISAVLKENFDHAFVIKQKSMSVDGTEYPFPEGFRLRDTNSGYLVASCDHGGVTNIGGYSCNGTLHLELSDLTVNY